MVQSSQSLNLPPSLRTPHLWPEADRLNLQRLIDQQQQAAQAKASSADLAKYQEDPEGYARDVLKVSLTDDQRKILNSIRVNRYTLAKASHDVGKTFIAAVAANWWYDCWAEHICLITAPTWNQALGLTFKEVKTARRIRTLPGEILDTGIVRDPDPILAASHFIKALNSDTSGGFQGEHFAPILIIVEEGVDVPRHIWEAIKGLMSSKGCRVLVIGNPTDKTGDFGDAAESDEYEVFSIRGLDHPNILAELHCLPPPIPKAITLQWVKEMLTTDCERVDKKVEDVFEWWAIPVIEAALNGVPIDPATSEIWYYKPTGTFQGRVLGEFPSQADTQLVPEGWLKDLPVYILLDEWLPELGCDTARFGDDRTTIWQRRGPCLLKGREIRQQDNVQVATALKDEALLAVEQWKGDEWTAKTEREDRIKLAKTIKIKIDVTGGLGTGPLDILRADGYNAIGVNSSSTANDTEQFKNIRTELWWNVRIRAQEKRLDISRLEAKIKARLIKEWTVVKYKAPGQKIADPKEVIKKRLGYSPDLADGANIALYDAPIKVSFVEQTGRLR